MEKKLSVGETLSESFAIYRDQAGVLLPVAFWLFLLAAVVEELTVDELALFWVGIVVTLVTLTLYQGMVVGLVRDVQDGRRDTSVGDLARSAMPVILPLIGAGFLIVIGVGLGLLLLIVPGLYLLTRWSVTAPALVVERGGVIASLRRSRELVQGHGWPVFGTLLVTFLLAGVVGLSLHQAALAISDGPILRVVLSVLASTVTAPIEALVASVLYFRLLKIERERPAESVLEQPSHSPG